MQKVSIIGVGNLGGGLAIALNEAGWRVSQLIVRNGRVAKRIRRNIIPEAQVVEIASLRELTAAVVFLCVDDPEIANVTDEIAALVRPSQTVFHTSGSRSSSVLSKLRSRGTAVGSLHPLTSISDPFAGAGQFRGTYFCIEGDPRTLKIGKKIARSMGGKPFSIDENGKALYHAAAVTAAGHVTALFATAVQMMELAGVKSRDARQMLLPLSESTLRNLETQEPKDALTGNFARLDRQTLELHLSAFRNLPPDLVRIYLDLGTRSLDLVEQRDGPSERLVEMRNVVSVAKRKFR